MPNPNTGFSTFLKYKDSLVWRQVTRWVKGQGAVKHLVWKGFLEKNGKIVDIPMFFVYVNVDESLGRASLSLAANIRYDPNGQGQQVVDTVPIGDIREFSDPVLAALLAERYGMKEVNFKNTPVGSAHTTVTKQLLMTKRMVNSGNSTIANIYLRKFSYSSKELYRTEVLIVDMANGQVSDDEPQRKREWQSNVQEASKTFHQTVRHLKTVGYVEADTVPSWANSKNWDFQINLPIEDAKRFIESIENVSPEQQKLMQEQMDAIDDDSYGVYARAETFIRTAQDVSQFIPQGIPDPSLLAPFVGTSQVDISDLRGAFAGVDDAVRLVNEWQPRLLHNVAKIFDYKSGSAYGVYVPMIDALIKEAKVKQELEGAGFTVQQDQSGKILGVTHPKKTDEEVRQAMNAAYQRAGQDAASLIGVNINKSLAAARRDIASMSGSLPEEQFPVPEQQQFYDMAVIRVGETIVHEATHSGGDEGEAGPESMDGQFVQWALEKLNQQRRQNSSNSQNGEFVELKVDPSQRIAKTWLNEAGLQKEAQMGAQFLKTSPLQDIGPAPWSGIFWDKGTGPIESMLNQVRSGDPAVNNTIVEKRIRQDEQTKWENEVDATESTENLLGKDRQPFEAYRHIETLMEERREQPLMTPVSVKSSSGIRIVKTALASESGSTFGWMNNLDLPMGERMWSGTSNEDIGLNFDWDEIRALPRYNPEYGPPNSKTNEMINYWKDPRLAPELWDRMISERPSMTSPGNRFASSANPMAIMAIVLTAAQAGIHSGNIRGTRFVCGMDVIPYVTKFFDKVDEVKTVSITLGKHTMAVWAVRSNIPDKILKLAESYTRGVQDGQKAFDYVTCLSSSRRSTIKMVIEEAKSICQKSGVRDVYVVGGFPRALVMNESWADIRDLDFSGAWPDQCLKVGGLVAEALKVRDVKTFHRTGTISWRHMGLKCDFRGKFSPKGLRELMRERNIPITPLNLDIYARDLTINMLLYSLSDGKIYDVTKTASDDIKSKILRTFFDPSKSIANSPLTILRAIKYAVRYGFAIEEDTSEAMKLNAKLLFDGRYTDDRLAVGYLEILSEGKERATEMLEYYGIKEELVRRTENASTN